jgi:rubredoxin
MRRLLWIETPDFIGFGCSECSWVFNPSKKPPVGGSLEEMKQNFAYERDKLFVAHDCAKHPKSAKAVQAS